MTRLQKLKLFDSDELETVSSRIRLMFKLDVQTSGECEWEEYGAGRFFCFLKPNSFFARELEHGKIQCKLIDEHIAHLLLM